MGITASKISFKQEPPEQLCEFKKLSETPHEYSIPEFGTSRKATDVWFLRIFIITTVLLVLPHKMIILLGYTLADVDWTSLDDEYDNKFIFDIRLRGFLNFTFNPSYIKQSLSTTLLITFIVSLLCILILLMFRYATETIIWSTLVMTYLIVMAFTVQHWILDSNNDPNKIYATLLLLVTTLIFQVFFKRIPIIINLFEEAVKVIFAMPYVILVSCFCSLLIAFVVITFCLLLIPVSSASKLFYGVNEIYYQWDCATLFTIFLHTFLTLWFINFILGCQTMIIAGAVSAWYFSRDKTSLGTPVKNSFCNVMKFHLGTAAFGSSILVVASLIKFFISFVLMVKRSRFFLKRLPTVLLYVSRNAYIQTAMHGKSFLKSGRRAVRLLFVNLNDVLALNCNGYFVLTICKILVCVFTFLLCFVICDDIDINVLTATVSFSLLLNIFMVNCFFKVFEIVIDTIYLCYCEDCMINNGTDRPYYMSMELMQFIDQSKDKRS